ncbi:DUF2868 domain-containing protein [Advenella sp. RU8]|uniref:DUF2868 domain-containing protein n=1 Tax=Advenella sp. RU8 TaxID=3399575 RepID=UPI003AB0DB94
MPQHSLKDYWVTETLRLREEHWGPIEDTTLLHQIRHSQEPVSDKIIQRAILIAKRDGLATTIEKWQVNARLAFWAMALLAIFTGMGMAASALGTGHVNLLLALVALLGLHAITYLFWLLSFFAPYHGGTLLGQAWLWLGKKLARGPDATLAPQAFINILNQNNGLRWLLSAISHGIWTLMMAAGLITLLALLAARQYTFGWETTILPASSFVSITQGIGFLPHLLGFSIPSADLVQQSSGLNTASPESQAIWSSWLIGAVFVYGLLLRLASLLLCLWKTRQAIRQIQIDETLPAYAGLVDRLSAYSEQIGVDAPAPALQTAKRNTSLNTAPAGSPLVLGLELSPRTPWPPFALPANVHDQGKLESREQRHRLLAQMTHQAVPALLIVCDAAQTPDRGTLHFITDLSNLASRTDIYLLNDDGKPENRLPLWKERLQQAGFGNEQLHETQNTLPQWIQAS